MVHLFRHTHGKNKGKFDIAFVVRGRYIVGSNQGYNTKRGAYKAMIALCKGLPVVGALGSCKFQDDTLVKPIVVQLVSNGNTYHSTNKSSKPYQPQTIKK